MTNNNDNLISTDKEIKKFKTYRPYVPIFLTALIGITLSVILFLSIKKWQQNQMQIAFENQSKNVAATLQYGINKHFEYLTSIKGLFSASEKVERAEFKIFVKETLEIHPEIQALEWIPRVTWQERAAYEKEAQSDGLNNFQFLEESNEGELVIADDRNEYFPIYYIEPLEGNEAVLGFDISTKQDRLRAMNIARETGKTTTAGKIKLIQKNSNRIGFFILVPIYKNNVELKTDSDRIENINGFVLGAFSVENLISSIVGAVENKDTEFFLSDDAYIFEKSFLYYHTSIYNKKSISDFSPNHLQKTQNNVKWKTQIKIADKTWSALFIPTNKFLASGKSWLPGNLLFGSLAITFLLCAYFYNKIKSTIKINHLNKLLNKQTNDLYNANKELYIEIENRKQLEKQNKDSLREKEILLQDVHNRVKNNLHIITSLLRLQSRKVVDKQHIEIFTECQNRIKSMELVHEKLYQSQDLSRIDLSEYIKNLSNSLLRSYSNINSNIKLKTEIENPKLNIDTTIPCGLIINELVSNSLKHAFHNRENGEIEIKLKITDKNMIKLTISDNGVGLPLELDFENIETIGLQLVDSLVKQLDGKMEIDTTEGTRFDIFLKYI